MLTFLFSVHTITEANQHAGLGRAEPGRWIFQPGVAPPLFSCIQEILTNNSFSATIAVVSAVFNRVHTAQSSRS